MSLRTSRLTFAVLLAVLAGVLPVSSSTPPQRPEVHPKGMRAHIQGGVNKPGWIEADGPLTIELAVSLAGGTSVDEENTPSAQVFRAGSHPYHVAREAWKTFTLQDNDHLSIARRVFKQW